MTTSGLRRTVSRTACSPSVVLDGEEEPVALDAAGDAQGRGPPMANGVERKFPDDAQDRERGVVGDDLARHVEADGQLGSV